MERIKAFFAPLVQRGPIGWLRRLFSIVQSYHYNISIIGQELDAAQKEVSEVLRYVKRATKVHVDVGVMADATQVIVIGKYRGRDYVNTFTLKELAINDLVERLTHMSRYANIGRIDTPLNVDATLKHSLKDRGAM